MSNSTIGYSANLTVNDGGTGATSGAATAFVEPIKFAIPHYEVGDSENTNLLSASKVRTFLPGMLDPGMFKFSINYNKADYVRLCSLKGASHTWVVTLPDEDGSGSIAAVVVTMNGYLKKHDLDVEAEPVMKVNCEVKLSGVITVA